MTVDKTSATTDDMSKMARLLKVTKMSSLIYKKICFYGLDIIQLNIQTQMETKWMETMETISC